MDEEPESRPNDRRGKHPKHLKGKAIGLFYANRKKEQNTTHSIKAFDSLNLSKEKKSQIESLLKLPSKENASKSTGNYDHITDSTFKQDFLRIVHGDIHDNPALLAPITRNDTLDAKFLDELTNKPHDPKYQQMLRTRQQLPSFDRRDQILDLLGHNQVVLISGETGCGKTTQVAQFILDDRIAEGAGSTCRIVCTQPRRISAVSIAERVADERAEPLGSSVGYHIRLERRLPRPRGSVCFCTTGVLLKQMETDPFLADYSHLILDEIHERDVMSDFLLALVKRIITKRGDLKLILMSATLNSEKFSKYFDNCAHINIPGFTYPVEEFHLEDVLQMTGFSFGEFNDRRGSERDKWRFKRDKKLQEKENEFYDYIVPHVNKLSTEGKYRREVVRELLNPESEKMNYEFILTLLVKICNDTDPNGAILIFLTGYAEILNLFNQISDQPNTFPKTRYLVLPLHSQMPTVNQRQIFDRPPKGVRKIVLSTNIAETSITIDDIVYVIDCGRIKIKNFNLETNTQTLMPEWVSLANASQRKGRAGRVRAGVCYHLFSGARKMLLETYQKPEILRTRLEDVILTAKVLKLGKVEEFFGKLVDRPDERAVSLSLELLRRLNALDDNENLTPLGYHLAKLPMSPQLGKMLLLGAIFSCLDPILSVAVTLDYKDPFMLPLGKEREADNRKMLLAGNCLSDHLFYHKVLKEFDAVKDHRRFCWENFLSWNTLTCLRDLKRQFMSYLYDMNFVPNTDPLCAQCNRNCNNTSLIKAIICAGLYPNVFSSMDHKKGRNILKNLQGAKVELHPKSVLSKRPLSKGLLVYYVKVRSTALFIHDATVVQPLPLIFFGDKHRYETNHDDRKIIRVNEDLKFVYNEETMDVVMQLREKLNWFLEYKISHPGVVDWESDGEDVKVLRAVMELVTAEEDEGEFGEGQEFCEDFSRCNTSSGGRRGDYGGKRRKETFRRYYN